MSLSFASVVVDGFFSRTGKYLCSMEIVFCTFRFLLNHLFPVDRLLFLLPLFLFLRVIGQIITSRIAALTKVDVDRSSLPHD